MADNTKPEELNEEQLGDVAGGFEEIKVTRSGHSLGGKGGKKGGSASKIKGPQPKTMERVHEDE